MSRRTLVVVTRPGDGLGFRLAGVRVEEVAEGQEAERLAPLLDEPDLGVAAVEADILAHIPPALVERVEKRGLPVLFPFALPRRLGETQGGESYVGQLVKRAIGYHVRLEG